MNERMEPLGSLAAGMQSRVSAKLGDIWWAFMLRGVVAGVLGIFALIWPTPTFTILTRMIGIYCLADGLPGLVGALRASDRGTYLLQAVVSLVVGGFLLFWPSTSVRTYSWFSAAGRSSPGSATSWPVAGRTSKTPTVASLRLWAEWWQ